MVAVAELVSDPRWIPHRIGPEGTHLTFVRLEREDHRTVTFLEDKYFEDRFARETVPLRDVADAIARIAAPPAPAHFVFHSSMALSTLIARLFDMPGTAMCLKEPIILNEIATLERRGRQVRPILNLVMRLLERPFAPGEAVVIKPGNVANNIIPDLMAVRPAAHALILYAPLPIFLRSIAKKGMWGRIVYRRLFAMLRQDGVFDAGFGDADLFEQTDLQITALAWLCHQAQFFHLPETLGDRVKASSSEAFLADKPGSLAALGRHFGLPIDVDAVMAGPLFSQHSKELGRAFDAEQRRREHEATEAAYGEEIGMVLEWARKVAETTGVPLELDYRLLG